MRSSKSVPELLSELIVACLKFVTYSTVFCALPQVLVLLDVTPDQSMVDEGVAREVINRIQKLRKKVRKQWFGTRHFNLLLSNLWATCSRNWPFQLNMKPCIIYCSCIASWLDINDCKSLFSFWIPIFLSNSSWMMSLLCIIHSELTNLFILLRPSCFLSSAT